MLFALLFLTETLQTHDEREARSYKIVCAQQTDITIILAY